MNNPIKKKKRQKCNPEKRKYTRMLNKREKMLVIPKVIQMKSCLIQHINTNYKFSKLYINESGKMDPFMHCW